MPTLKDRPAWRLPGPVAVVVEALVLAAFLTGHAHDPVGVLWALGTIFVLVASGLFVVQPNDSLAVVFFGRYIGTVAPSGLHWTVPFTVRRRVSRRVRNFTSQSLKVNDAAGNPVEIAAVFVWRVADAAQALFDVDDYVAFVGLQAETALRSLAGAHPYDAPDGQVSLLASQDVIADNLVRHLQERLRVAGVEVLEARLAHLAYAPEVAQTMLRRQQAAAVVAARQTLVAGAVGMVHEALDQLTASGLVELDDEKKAAMVNNLMVVLVSEETTHPIVNAGTLYA